MELPQEPVPSRLPQERHSSQLPHVYLELEEVQEREQHHHRQNHPKIIPLVLNGYCKQKKQHYHHHRKWGLPQEQNPQQE